MSRANRAIKHAIDNNIIRADTDDGVIYGVRGYALKPAPIGKGHLAVNIPDEHGKQRMVFVHRIIGYVLFGDAIFEPGVELDHINQIKTDNRAENLRLTNRSGNSKNVPVSTWKRVYYGDLPQKIHNDYEAGLNKKQISKKYEINYNVVSAILSGKYSNQFFEAKVNPLRKGRYWKHDNTGSPDFWNMIASGYTYSEIQKEIGISIQAISHRLRREAENPNSPYYDIAINRRKANRFYYNLY